jgi:hemerythrin
MPLEFFPWDGSLDTGVRILDQQHQDLFEEVNKLLLATARHEGHKIVGKFLGYLGQYVVEHFATEADLMEKTGYPAMEEHMAAHLAFAEEYQRLTGTLTDYSMVVVIQVASRVNHWMHEHIPQHDQALVAFLRKRDEG